MSDGIPAGQLSDDLLRHELSQLKRVQTEIEQHGTDHQKSNHAARTAELEAEFVKRHGSNASEEETVTPSP